MRPGVRVMSKQMDSTLVCPSRSVIILVMPSSQIYNLTRDTRFFPPKIRRGQKINYCCRKYLEILTFHR